MSKTFKKKSKHSNEYEEVSDDYGYVKHTINKSKQKRFDRALKVLDVDDLMEYEEQLDDWEL